MLIIATTLLETIHNVHGMVYDQQVIQIYPDHATLLQAAGVFQWPPRLCRNTVQIVPSKAQPPRDLATKTV